MMDEREYTPILDEEDYEEIAEIAAELPQTENRSHNRATAEYRKGNRYSNYSAVLLILILAADICLDRIFGGNDICCIIKAVMIVQMTSAFILIRKGNHLSRYLVCFACIINTGTNLFYMVGVYLTDTSAGGVFIPVYMLAESVFCIYILFKFTSAKTISAFFDFHHRAKKISNESNSSKNK